MTVSRCHQLRKKEEVQMIACRSFARVDRVWKVANTHTVCKPVDYCQGSYACHVLSFAWTMGGGKDSHNYRDRNKKQKIINPIWRPLSTKSSSSEGPLAKDVDIEHENILKEVACDDTSKVGGLVQVVHCTTFDHVLHVQHVSKEGELIINDGAKASVMLECGDPSEALEEGEATISKNVMVDSLLQSGFTARDNEPNETLDYVQADKEGKPTLDTGKNIYSISEAEKHSISVEVAAPLIRFITGKGRCMQKQIEEEMGVKIILPLSKKEDSIIIEGISIESVTKASERIQVILEEAINSPMLDYSHFVSLPLSLYPGLVDKLINFQNSILGTYDPSEDEALDSDSNGDKSDNEEDKGQRLDGGPDVAVKLKVEDCQHVKVEINQLPVVSCPPKASQSSSLSELGIEKSIFIKQKTFHLTVLMLKLWSKERVAAATEVLQSISSEVMDALDSRPVFVKLKGLDCMRGSLAKARVLYVPIEEIGSENRLLRACQLIIDGYVEAGLVLEKDARQKLKLHATVMNARHRKRKKRTRRIDSFDARGIMEKYGSEDWGEYLIREAHLSQRFKFDENGYYHCCASIPFPNNTSDE